ncbi:MAG: olefin beta-lactone synthetase [Parashewanella sp.]
MTETFLSEKRWNLCRHLQNAAVASPNLLAVAVQSSVSNQYRYQELTFSQLNERSDEIAYALNASGIEAGMKAVLMVTPSVDFFLLTFALFKAGIVPIIVDPGMGVKNLKQCFVESKPDVFIGIAKAHIARRVMGWGKSSVKFCINVDSPIDQPNNRWFKSLITGAKNLSALVEQALVNKNDEAYPIKLLSADQICAILFTSGSTGSPKGVVYSHKMFEAQIAALKNDYQIKQGERDLATFPLFSLFGPALGMASIVPDMDASKPITANPNHLFAAIEQYQCSNMFVNPALLNRLGEAGERNKHKLPSIKRVISAGAPVTIEAVQQFQKMLNPRVEILTSYGATESLPIALLPSSQLSDTADATNQGAGICIGKPLADVDIKIIEITEQAIATWHDGLSLSANKIGEIVVAGDVVNQSYYQREQANEQAKIFDNDLQRYRHRMGDLGYFDDDGKLWMCGRKAHRVVTENKVYFSIPAERIFNTHANVKRSALVAVRIEGKITPLICLELVTEPSCNSSKSLYADLRSLAQQYQQTQGIQDFLIHPDFPMDVRHNAKIFREKLAVWAQKKVR